MAQFTSIDDYITAFPEAVQQVLRDMRRTSREAAPAAQEAISYQMPTFKLNGNLVHFAAHKQHLGFYPAPSGIEAFREALAPYAVSKGAIRFPLDEPLPHALIKAIVAFRVQEQLAKRAK